MKLGKAKSIITPAYPIRLCGYASRNKPFEMIAEDIYLRVHIQEQKGERFLFVYGDLLWWNSDFISEVRPGLSEKYLIRQENIWFAASHNHSGPGTGNSFTALLETYDKSYGEWLAKQIDKTIEKALDSMENVSIVRYDGSCDLNVYRRKTDEAGIVRMCPNYYVAADTTLTIIGYYRENGTLKGTLIHYPCHANLSDQNVLQPDYPGIALRLMDEQYPESISMFFQGCTADLRPNSVLGNQFISCDYSKVQLFAGRFFECCQKAIADGGKKIELSLDCYLQSRVKRRQLPLKQEFTWEQVRKALKSERLEIRQWAEKVLEKDVRSWEELEISCISYGNELSFIFINAEISQIYAEYARTLYPGCICAAYSNGMIGYLASETQINEGGYEPEGSALYFALAGTYKPEIERIIKRAIKELLEETNTEREV